MALRLRTESFDGNQYPDVSIDDIVVLPLTESLATYQNNYCGTGGRRYVINIPQLIEKGSITIYKEFGNGDDVNADRVTIGTLSYDSDAAQVVFTPVEGAPRVEKVGDSRINDELFQLIDATNFES